MPRMDITPEILTHARTLDLATGGLLAENEREWSTRQTAATLTPYLAESLRILKEAGLDPTGITSPWDFGIHVEADYRLAITRAMAEVVGRRQTWYFLHTEAEALDLRSRVVSREGDARLVSIASQCGDYLWHTMETRDDGPAFIAAVADKYLTEDGRAGRLADLFHAGTPMVFHTHWQSLCSNGRATGLRALDEVGRRVAAAWGRDVRWVTCSELAAEL